MAGCMLSSEACAHLYGDPKHLLVAAPAFPLPFLVLPDAALPVTIAGLARLQLEHHFHPRMLHQLAWKALWGE